MLKFLLFPALLAASAAKMTAQKKQGMQQNSTKATCVNSEHTGLHTFQIPSGGRTRTFNMFVPDGLVDGEPRPVLFLWHGFAGTSAKILEFSHANVNAQKSKWIVVYPTGTGLIKGFNGAGCCPGVLANDVQFARDMLTWLTANMCADTTNVFSSGFSNGGFMSNRLACEASDIFTAIAPHSGTQGKSFSCSPTKGMPVLLFHGDADPTVPYYGNGQWLGLSDLANKWATLNECGDDANARDSYMSDTTTCVRFDKCKKDNVPVEFCSIKGLTHSWSGSGDFDVDATDYMFQFFEALPSMSRR